MVPRRRTSSLEEYRRKRDFHRTPEPPARAGRRHKQPRFVIQKHAATSLHYDFRLEADGVLKSWAVPKGPSLNPRDKRLAIRTEDHPLSYATFEGVIPEGAYGAGAVIVWDTGTYQNLSDVDGAMAVDQGHVKVWLEGKKIRGGFALTRTAGRDKEQWIMVKMSDEAVDRRRNPVKTQPESALSGRTIEDLATSA